MGAARAQMMGLVNEVVPSDMLMVHVMSLSRQLAALSPVSLHALKCVLMGGNEAACFDAVWGKEHWREGIDALLSKRESQKIFQMADAQNQTEEAAMAQFYTFMRSI